MKITHYDREEIIDPTGILPGRRYEFFLAVELDEEDELTDQGSIGVRAILVIDGEEKKVVSSTFYERSKERDLPYELEEEEHLLIEQYCIQTLED